MKNIIENEKLLAHIDINSNRKEKLIEHSTLCLEVFEKFNRELNIEEKMKRKLKELNIKNKRKKFKLNDYEIEFIINMQKDLILYHDVGKCNLRFQIDKMRNKKFKNIYNDDSVNSEHSILSTVYFVEYYFDLIEDDEYIQDKKFFRYVVLMLSGLIYNHHTALNDMFEVFKEDGKFQNIKYELDNINFTYFKKKFKCINDISNIHRIIGYNKNKIFNNYEFDGSIFYIMNKITYSLLINCDFISTKCFKQNKDINDFKLDRIEDIEKIKETFNKTKIKQNIDNYKINPETYDKKDINTLRCHIATQIYDNLVKAIGLMLYYIKAPTGSGKTYISLNCCLELLNELNNKIIYVFPINSISTQTKNEFDKIFKDVLNVTEVNSTAKIKESEKDGEVDYNTLLLDKQQLNYPFLLTSNVKLFNCLFGTSREDALSLIHLANSIIVLDEIQNYNNNIWKEFIDIIYKFADFLNIKIIIMSATLPKLDKLVDIDKNKIADLTPESNEWFTNPLFKNRVEIDTELLNIKNISLETIKDKMIKEIKNRNSKLNCKSKFLIEFISKKKAKEFYNYLNECDDINKDEYEILSLDGDDNNIIKERIINKCKQENVDKNIILVATQLIEAGVDIDMDLGAKDFSFPDADEQFMGRINRSCKKKYCKVFFFDVTDAADIYKGDRRCGFDISDKEILEILYTKDFDKYYEKIFDRIELFNNTYENTYERFLDDLKKLNYKEIHKHMKLIDNDTISIFIPNIFKEDEKVYDGYKKWNEYIELIESKIEYCEKKIKIHNTNTDLQLFTYNIYNNNKYDLSNLENIGGIYYLDEEGLINNDKLNVDLLDQILKNDRLFY